MLSHAWPAVPKPFADETFGGWIGRMAGRYGITVDELSDAAGVTLDLHGNGYGWLAASPPVGRALARLADKCRMLPSEIEALGAPSVSKANGLPYCYRCLVLNPCDVFAPYWKASWSQQEFWTCDGHDGWRDYLIGKHLSEHRNFPSLLATLEKRWIRFNNWRVTKGTAF